MTNPVGGAPLALTMGEPAGIGGEIALMAWAARQPYYIGEGLPDHRRLAAGAVNLLAMGLEFGLYALPLSAALLLATGATKARRGWTKRPGSFSYPALPIAAAARAASPRSGNATRPPAA